VVLNPKILAAKGFNAGFEIPAIFRHVTTVNATKVRLFIKPYCSWCHKAMNWLDAQGVDYEVLDVIADDAAYHEMVKLSDQELAPVIDVDGRILADFGPDQLAAFWEKLEHEEA
jgi:glutaredoxin 3